MEYTLEHVDKTRIPEHVAIIMDGNGRWAQRQGKPRAFGHKAGVGSVREVSEAAAKAGVKYLTLYAFSTENWARPIMEVKALMSLLVESVRGEMKTLNKNNIRLIAIGDLDELPEKSRNALREGIQMTANNSGLTLILALNYSARHELTRAMRNMAQACVDGKMDVGSITEEVVEDYLYTKSIPDPELLIRTSGELRISNFLLWQIAYTELCFFDIYWPEFKEKHFYQALSEYQNRDRRFGKVSEDENKK